MLKGTVQLTWAENKKWRHLFYKLLIKVISIAKTFRCLGYVTKRGTENTETKAEEFSLVLWRHEKFKKTKVKFSIFIVFF